MFDDRIATADPSRAAERTATADRAATAGPAAPIATGEKKTGATPEAIRASVDELIDRANRYSRRNEREAPGSQRVVYQYD